MVRRLAAFCLVLILAACDTKATPPPSGPATSVTPDGTALPGASSSPVATGGPVSSGGPGGAATAERELPIPTLDDPFAIGQALYDPTQLAGGVTSLLHLMGVGTYEDDGTPIDQAGVTKGGDPWLFQSEVWGLVDMGVEDLNDAGEDGPTYRLADLYDSLQGTLPPDLTLDAFVGAYSDAYAAHPDDLAPSVLLGQPVDASTPLTRVQLWLLYMDGFVDLAPATSADVRQGPVAATARAHFGTANANLPPLVQPQSLTSAQWLELISHFLTLLNAIPFAVTAGSVHEGHGSTGQPEEIKAHLYANSGFISPVTGTLLLQANSGAMGGLELRWGSRDVAVFADHGTLAASIPGTAVTDAGGIASITYTPKREAANGQGAVSHDAAETSATVNARDLLVHAYNIDDQSVLGFLMAQTLHGTRTERAWTEIEWHGPGIEVTLENLYNVNLDAAQGIGGMVAVAHRDGTDTFTGTLTKRSDGTYRGVLSATTQANVKMGFGAGGLVGKQCEETTSFTQNLAVVGTLKPTSVMDPTQEEIEQGNIGTDDLLLVFTPKDAPSAEGQCQSSIPFFTTNARGNQVISGWYASFSDSRITDPSLAGYGIHLPKPGEKLTYFDWRQSADNLPPDFGVDSTWTITVTRQPGS
jgi:hypothetical protein